MKTSCPICGKPVEPPEANKAAGKTPFPFCSDRCQLIDLGRWLDGKYQIPVANSDVEEPGEGAGNAPRVNMPR